MCFSYFIFQKKAITLRNSKGKHVFVNAEFADNIYKRAIGYMFREKIGEHEGMLFIFPDLSYRSFWMWNVRFPLEAICFSDDGNVVDILKMNEPNKRTIYTTKYKAKYVLEVPKGFAEKNNIRANHSRLVLDSINR